MEKRYTESTGSYLQPQNHLEEGVYVSEKYLNVKHLN